MNSAISTTSSTTTPLGRFSQSISVKRPMYPAVSHQRSYRLTVSPNMKMPNRPPRTKNRPSSLPVIIPTSEVPGQKPPTMKPTPMISPPRMPDHR